MVARLEHVLGVNRPRANAIARTETMRISNLASYVQSLENNQTYYTVDYRAEARELCIDTYEGQTFPIDGVDYYTDGMIVSKVDFVEKCGCETCVAYQPPTKQDINGKIRDYITINDIKILIRVHINITHI